MKNFIIILLLFLIVHAWTSSAQGGSSPAELYFSNLHDIMRLRNGSSSVVFYDPSLIDGIDCNVCDRMVYWIDGLGRVQKVNPANQTSVQTIVDGRDVGEPRGLAVDWVGNNVFFSHGANHQGRIEVVSCDGRFRRIIKQEIIDVGPLAIDVTRGYLYFVEDTFSITRMAMDGSHPERIIDFSFPKIVGLEIDISTNTLYWVNDGQGIKYTNLDNVDGVLTFNELPINISAGSPKQLTIHDNTLFWTVPNGVDVTTPNLPVESPGGLYSTVLDGNNIINVLLEDRLISPQDLCYFFEANMPSSGCAVNNGGCDQLCLTVPASSGTMSVCECSTGLVRTPTGCPLYPNHFLVFSQEHIFQNRSVSHTDIQMISLDVGGPPFIHTLTDVTIPLSSARYIAYDITQHEVYWSQFSPPSIRKAELVGNGMPKVVVNTSISHPEGLAVDPYHRNLFWIDSQLDKIEAVSLEGGFRKVIVRTGRKPHAIALDLMNSYVYWTDLDNGRPRVERCRLDGSDQEEISSEFDADRIKTPAVITVDPVTGDVYWAETTNMDSIHKYNFATGGFSDFIIPGGHPGDISGLAVFENYLYWSDISGTDASLGRVTTDSRTNEEIFSRDSGVQGINAILVADEHQESVVISDCHCDQLCLPNGSPSPCRCADNLSSDSRRCLDPLGSIYIATNTSTYQFVEQSIFWTITASGTLAVGMDRTDLHINDNTIFWISYSEKKIYSSPLDSLSPTVVVGGAVGYPVDLAVDWFGQNLYWIDSQLRTIEVAKLTGEHRIILYKIPEQFGVPKIIVLDPFRGNLYWAPSNGAKIYRARMDGTSTLEQSSVLFWENRDSDSSQLSVFGMTMHYNEFPGTNDHLYFGLNNQESNIQENEAEVFSISVSVSDTEAASFGGGFFVGLGLATLHGNFYILAKEIFGYSVQLITTEPSTPDGVLDVMNVCHIYPIDCDPRPVHISMLHHSVQPGQHECSVRNNECSGSAVCLVENAVSGDCVCSPLEASGFSKDSDGVQHRDCSHSESFVMIATSETVFYLPVPSHTGFDSTAQMLPIGPVHNITTINYDPILRSVLLTDDNSNLHRVALDSSSSEIILLRENIVPSSLAYDWKGGHIFVTEFPGFQIELAVINGNGVGSVINIGLDKRYQLNIIGQIAFDSVTSILYWTNPSQTGTILHSMSLLMRIEETVDIEIGPMNELSVVENNCLLWISQTDPFYKIEKYSFESSQVYQLYNTTQPVKGVTGTMVDGVLYVFWFSDGVLYYHNGVSVQVYRNWSPDAPIVGMFAYTQPSSTEVLECRQDSRPCSHFCLNHPDHGLTCECPVNTGLLQGSNTQCSDVNCGHGSLLPCGGMYNECFPSVYWCDGIPHCRNGADEHCNCSLLNTFACWDSDTCVPMSAKCDGINDCPNNEDELDCCDEGTFGCYVEDANLDILGGGPETRYSCFPNISRCDTFMHCVEPVMDQPTNCPSTDSTPAPPPPPSTQLSLPIIITCVVVAAAVSAITIILCCYFGRVFVKRKKHEYASNSMSRAFNSNLSNTYKPRDSPQLGGGSVSDYFSELSNGTITTQIGSTRSQNSTHKRQSGLSTDPSNPPPSPMTYRPSPAPLTDIEDNESVFSETISEFPIPPVPNPSLNYDIVSDSQSYSVSHSQYPATINGRANPLMQRPYPNHHPNYQNGGYVQQPQWAPRVPQANGSKYPYSNASYYHYPKPRTELGSLAQTETESTLSITTVSTENRDSYQFEEGYAPPGRPPSPVTIISDYHPQAPPMSPDSTLSEVSDDQCSERHLHQT